MPNTIPIPELIAEEIVARLNEITKENGYEFDVSEVVRPSRRGENWRRLHNGIGVIQGSPERMPDLDCPGNPPAIAYAITFDLVCICRDSENSIDAHTTATNYMVAAMQRAIANTGDRWYTLGDFAFDCDFGTPEPVDTDDAEFNSVRVPLVIYYRVSENNPLEVRA
jgi:hypothetical protein